MLDDAADVNIISQKLVLGCNLQPVPNAALPAIEAFRGEKGFCYGAYRVKLRLADSMGVERESESTFYSADIEGPQILLGRLWRRQLGVIVDSRDDK